MNQGHCALATLLCLLVTDCIATADLRNSFANEFACSSDAVDVQELGAGRFRVNGCGHDVFYSCSRHDCVPTDSAATTPGSPPMTRAQGTQDAKTRVGEAHLETSKAGAAIVALDLRLDPQTLLTLRGRPALNKPLTFQIRRLAVDRPEGECKLEALLNGQHVALQKAPLGVPSAEANDGRSLVEHNAVLPSVLIGDLAIARKLSLKDCQARWSLSEQAVEEVRHFAELYQQEQAWNRPATEDGSGGLLAPGTGWPAWSARGTAPIAPASGPLLDATALFKALSPSVFKLVVESGAGTVQGSAVAVTTSDLLTNCHVLEGAQTITLKQGKTERGVRITAANPARDRCVISVAEANLTPVRGVRGYDELQIGEPLYTLGSPNGLELSLSSGILSGKREEGTEHYVQTTAAISPGSSGGGLFDARGNLVGITTLVLAGRERLNQSLNFAIPAASYWQP